MSELENALKKIEKLQEILFINQILASSFDLKTIQKKSLARLKKILGCEHVLLHVFNHKENILKCNFFDERGMEFNVTHEVNEQTLVGSCAYFKSMLHVKDPSCDLRYQREDKVIKALKATDVVTTPLMHNGELFGVLMLIHSEGSVVNDDDLEFLGHISSGLAVTLENVALIERLHEQFIQVCSALGDAIAKKDSYTGGHTKRVSMFAEMVAKEMEFGSKDLIEIKLAAALHDIGKIGIEDRILKKDSPLSEEEFLVMKEHPRMGHEILAHLSHIPELKNVIDGMRFHHERPDGLGYPYGLKESEIPLIAQIISVADTFDAMISTRPYRKGLPPMEAYEEIVKNSGKQFSERVVEAFVKGFQKTSMYRPEKLEVHKKAS